MIKATKGSEIMKKIFVLILIPVLLLCSCGGNKIKLSDADPSDIIDEVYNKLPKDAEAREYVPCLITSEINERSEEYYLGISGVRYKKGAASEAFEQPTTYSFCVVIFEDDADYDAERIKIEQNINKSKWVCASAEEAFVVRYRNTAAVIMGPKNVCSELENAFLSVVSSIEK